MEELFILNPWPRIRQESSNPLKYRLGLRAGQLVLQGMYSWVESGGDEPTSAGEEWRDIPNVDLDSEQSV